MGFEYMPKVFMPGKRVRMDSMNELTDEEE
jgi:hypothetical protein